MSLPSSLGTRWVLCERVLDPGLDIGGVSRIRALARANRVQRERDARGIPPAIEPGSNALR